MHSWSYPLISIILKSPFVSSNDYFITGFYLQFLYTFANSLMLLLFYNSKLFCKDLSSACSMITESLLIISFVSWFFKSFGIFLFPNKLSSFYDINLSSGKASFCLYNFSFSFCIWMKPWVIYVLLNNATGLSFRM